MFVKIGQLSNKEYLLPIRYIYNNLVYTNAKMIELTCISFFGQVKIMALLNTYVIFMINVKLIFTWLTQCWISSSRALYWNEHFGQPSSHIYIVACISFTTNL